MDTPTINRRSKEIVVALITARRDSERVPYKNRETVNGSSLWHRSYLFARACGLRPIVDTDDEVIIEACRHRGYEVHKRTVASEAEGGTHWQAIRAAADDLGLTHFALLQPTSPFRSRQVMLDALAAFDEHKTTVLTYSTPEVWDGNIGIFKHPETVGHPVWVRNPFACSLQIDTPEDLAEARSVARGLDGLFSLGQ